MVTALHAERKQRQKRVVCNGASCVMNERLLCGGEWKSRATWIRTFQEEGWKDGAIDHFLFFLSQHQPKGGYRD